jgi:hypothetical protein
MGRAADGTVKEYFIATPADRNSNPRRDPKNFSLPYQFHNDDIGIVGCTGSIQAPASYLVLVRGGGAALHSAC